MTPTSPLPWHVNHRTDAGAWVVSEDVVLTALGNEVAVISDATQEDISLIVRAVNREPHVDALLAAAEAAITAIAWHGDHDALV